MANDNSAPGVFYTTYGGVRGPCNHAHQSYRTAWMCRRADERAVRMHGLQPSAYTDRLVYRVEAGRAYPADPGGGIKDRAGESDGRPWADVYRPQD